MIVFIIRANLGVHVCIDVGIYQRDRYIICNYPLVFVWDNVKISLEKGSKRYLLNILGAEGTILKVLGYVKAVEI